MSTIERVPSIAPLFHLVQRVVLKTMPCVVMKEVPMKEMHLTTMNLALVLNQGIQSKQWPTLIQFQNTATSSLILWKGAKQNAVTNQHQPPL